MKSFILKSALIIFILITFAHPSAALDPEKPLRTNKISILDINDRLKSEMINSISQDKNHYMWFVTISGLIKYNGSNIEIFNGDNTAELKKDHVRSIYTDSRGIIWFCKRGTGILSYSNDHFSDYIDENGLPFSKVTAITETESGVMLFGTSAGIIIKENNKYSFIPYEKNSISEVVMALKEDRSGQIWIGTSKGLYLLASLSGETIKPILKLRNIFVHSIVEDPEHNIWVATANNGIFKINGSLTKYSTVNGLVNNHVRCLFTDSHGAVWAGTIGGGIQRFYKGKAETLSQNTGLAVDSVLSLFEDHEGTMWIGTSGGGLNLLSDLHIYTLTGLNGDKFDNVYGIYQDRTGNVWISASGKGLFSLSPNGRVRKYDQKDGIKNPTSNNIFSFTETKDGSLWMGSYEGGIYRLKNGEISVFDKRNGLDSNTVLGVYADSSDRLWAVTIAGGVFLFNNSGFRLIENLKIPLSIIQEDKDGNIWIGTIRNRIFRYDGHSFRSFTKQDGFNLNIISSIYVAEDNSLFVGTVGGGMNIFKDNKVLHLTTVEGLPDNNVNSIIEDNIDSYWIGSDAGIIQLNKEVLNEFLDGKINKVTVRTFGLVDGMKSLNCFGGFQSSGFKSYDGKIWIPTTNGISIVDPARLHINSVPPAVFIEKILINGQSAGLSGKINIPPGNNRLEIRYAALSFVNPAGVRYKFKMDDYDDNWINSENRNTAYYTNLPAGDYTFKVVACNNDGIWNMKGDSIRIYQKPVFYKTIWAFIIYLIIAILIIDRVYKFRIRKVEKRKQVLESIVNERTIQLQQLNKQLDKKVRERTKELEQTNQQLLIASQVKSQILANVSHELRTPLAVILGYTECLLTTKNTRAKLNLTQTLNKIVYQSRNLLRMVESLLNINALESGTMKLNLTQVDINKTIRQVKKQLQLNLIQGDLFKLQLDRRIAKCYLDESKVFQILRNIIDNAIKFSPGKKNLFVTTSLEGNYIIVKCHDHGIGILKKDIGKIFEPFFQVDASSSRSFNGAGLGLYISKALVELHQGKIKVASELNRGTIVTVYLPVNLGPEEYHGQTEEKRKVELAYKAFNKILVVDDNIDIPELVQIFFRDEYKVYAAYDGKDAVKKARKIQPNVILMDLAMPVMDGYTATELIKNDKITQDIPVIALSARSMPEEVEHAFRSGCIEHIAKPFNKDKLRIVINKYCTKQRLSS